MSQQLHREEDRDSFLFFIFSSVLFRTLLLNLLFTLPYSIPESSDSERLTFFSTTFQKKKKDNQTKSMPNLGDAVKESQKE